MNREYKIMPRTTKSRVGNGADGTQWEARPVEPVVEEGHGCCQSMTRSREGAEKKCPGLAVLLCYISRRSSPIGQAKGAQVTMSHGIKQGRQGQETYLDEQTENNLHRF